MALEAGEQKSGVHMPPAMRKAVDVAIAVGLTAAVFFVIVVANAFLMARGSYAAGLSIWYAFVLRPDILGTMVLTAVVTFAYVWFGKGSGRPRL
jgi:uncharacterized membrane protein YhaH (DUF805 family)